MTISPEEMAMYNNVGNTLKRQRMEEEHTKEKKRLESQNRQLRQELQEARNQLDEARQQREQFKKRATSIDGQRQEFRDNFQDVLRSLRTVYDPLEGIAEVAHQHAVAAQINVLTAARSDYRYKKGNRDAERFKPEKKGATWFDSDVFDLATRREANLQAIAHAEFWSHYVSDLDWRAQRIGETASTNPEGAATAAFELSSQIDLASGEMQRWIKERVETLRKNVYYLGEKSSDGHLATVPRPESIPPFLDKYSEHDNVLDRNDYDINGIMLS